MPPLRSKRQLARQQLEDAIRLFLEGRIVSALTLAGAAEEILAKLGGLEGKLHPLDSVWNAMNRNRSTRGQAHVSKNFVHGMFNTGRNLVKHHDRGDPVRVRLNDWFYAVHMITRAIFAADQLGLKFTGRKAFHAYLRPRGLL